MVLFTAILVLGCSEKQPSKTERSFSDRLQSIPGITVEVSVASKNPACRIVHILNRHVVTREMLAADLRDQDPSITDEAIDRQFEELLDEVESLQTKQKELLLALKKEFGIRRIFYEGLTEQELPKWKERLSRLRTEPDRFELLRIGAVGQLEMLGEIEAIPVDNWKLLEAARPMNGDFSLNRGQEAREDFMVQATRRESLAVVILGRDHDLSDNIKRAGVVVVYLRIR